MYDEDLFDPLYSRDSNLDDHYPEGNSGSNGNPKCLSPSCRGESTYLGSSNNGSKEHYQCNNCGDKFHYNYAHTAGTSRWGQDDAGNTARCVECGQPFTSANVYTPEGWKETKISGMCEKCFDRAFGEDGASCDCDKIKLSSDDKYPNYSGASGRDLADLKRKAQESSRNGYVQHVNETYPGIYKIEDWYDSDQTRASYENGREL
jgi:hypothetical protein